MKKKHKKEQEEERVLFELMVRKITSCCDGESLLTRYSVNQTQT
jgi:hypothetical protein